MAGAETLEKTVWRRVRTEFGTASIRRWQLQVPEGVEWVVWRRLDVPKRFAAVIKDARYPVRLEVELEDGLPRCLALSRIDEPIRISDGSQRAIYLDAGPPLTAELLRQIPLKRLVNEIAATAADHFGRRVPAAAAALRRDAPLYEKLDEAARRARLRAAKGLSDALLEEVAALYDQAAAAGLPPTRTTWEKLNQRRKGRGPARSTVARWVQEARARGLLPPTERGQARGWRAPV